MRKIAIVAAMLVVSCAAIVGIPQREGSFCARGPEHALCDDFDNEKGWQWTAPDGEPEQGMKVAVVPAGVSSPNAFRIDVPALEPAGPPGASILGHRFQRGPDGIRVSAKVKIEKNGLPSREAGIIGDGGPDGATILLYAIIWDAGIVALALRNDGLYLLDAVTSTIDSGILSGTGRQLVTTRELERGWLPISFEVHLAGQQFPYVGVFIDADLGRSSANTFELDQQVRRLASYAQVLYGAIVVPPNGETSILLDDLTVDYPRDGG